MTETPKIRSPRTLEDIFKAHPDLQSISDVALITEVNDQIWYFWVSKVGSSKVREECEAVQTSKGNKDLVDFNDVHEKLMLAPTITLIRFKKDITPLYHMFDAYPKV